MRDPRCAQCHQAILSATDGLRCACQVMRWEDVQRFLAVYETMPDPWPVLDTLDVLTAVRTPVPETADER